VFRVIFATMKSLFRKRARERRGHERALSKPEQTNRPVNTHLKHLLLLPVLMAGLGLFPARRVAAQNLTNLHNFTGVTDGANPYGGLTLSGNTLYGTASGGGSAGNGTVFAVNLDGTGFTNLHRFAFNDGINPFAGLILSGHTLYGTTSQGGSAGNGAVFALNTDGTGFANLHNFTGGSDGANPYAGLLLSGNTLYGTTSGGGRAGQGAVFALNTDGTGFANLHSFTGGSDGASPYAGLILSGNVLYGTANQGGSAGQGAVFALNTDGTGFTNLHSFTGGSDGAAPSGGLILSGNTLYGTASQGGSAGNGAVFALNTDGTGFTNLHSFIGVSDGANPYAALVLSDNTLYGTATGGGSAGNGAVFALNINGTGFTNLHTFTGRGDGAAPRTVILSGNTLYGAVSSGGSAGDGTVFGLSLGSVSASPPQLTISLAGTNVVLTWPNDAPGFTLQSLTNLVPPEIWTTVNGQNVVTNPIAGKQMFYRLSQ
jgi:uncharacterized repeat protein (TIGR03803 family)